MLWAARDYESAGSFAARRSRSRATLGDAPLIARSLNRVGNWYVNREEPLAALPFHDEALAAFEAAGDERGVAETVDLMAMTYHIAGEQETAGTLLRTIDRPFHARWTIVAGCRMRCRCSR